MLIVNALVLARADYRDQDRMITLLTPDHGRIDAIARACRRPKSPLLSASERLTAGEYGLIESHGRYTVVQCDVTESFYALRTDLEKLTHAAYYLHLLLLAAQPELPCEALFHMALRALAYLCYGTLPPALVTAAFEMHYAAILGISPRVDACVRCGRVLDQEAARFDVRLGGACCTACMGGGHALSPGARRILQRTPRTRFEVIDKLLPRTEWPEAAGHIRRFLADRLDRPPHTWPALPCAAGADVVQ